MMKEWPLTILYLVEDWKFSSSWKYKIKILGIFFSGKNWKPLKDSIEKVRIIEWVKKKTSIKKKRWAWKEIYMGIKTREEY